MKQYQTYIYQFIIVLLLFLVGFFYAYDFHAYDTNYITDVSVEEGTYLRFVYIGSSGCGFSNNNEMHTLIAELKNVFYNFAHESGHRFISTGISMDQYSVTGFDFLRKSGSYDEIVVGAGWMNIAADYYVWDEFQGYADTPQVLILISEYKVESGGRQIGNIIREDKLLDRFTGVNEINSLMQLMKNTSQNEIMKFFGI